MSEKRGQKLPRLTPLTCLVMGLLKRSPRTGYQLLKALEDLPLIRTSNSPGAIYPLLSRLEKAELVGAEARSQGHRASRVYRLTEAGDARLREWIVTPPERDEIANHPDLLVIRFWFLPFYLEPVEIQGYLARYRADVVSLEAEAEAYLEAAAEDMAPGSRLAFDLSLSLIRAQRDWIERVSGEVE